MSAPRAAAQLFRIAMSVEYFIPPATTRAGTAQRAIPTNAKHILGIQGKRHSSKPDLRTPIACTMVHPEFVSTKYFGRFSLALL